MQVRRVCIKLCGASNSQFGHLRDLFPAFSFHFSTRRPLPSVASNRKPLAPLVNTIYDRSGAFWKEVVGEIIAMYYIIQLQGIRHAGVFSAHFRYYRGARWLSPFLRQGISHPFSETTASQSTPRGCPGTSTSPCTISGASSASWRTGASSAPSLCTRTLYKIRRKLWATCLRRWASHRRSWKGPLEHWHKTRKKDR